VLAAVVVAAKFYCEADDVVVNGDIARVLDLQRYHPHNPCSCLSGNMAQSDFVGRDTDETSINLINSIEFKLCLML